MGGVPPLDQVNIEELRAALEVALESASSEHQALSAQETEGSFEDTLLALDRLGEPLKRVRALYAQWSACFSSDEMRALRREMEPRLTAYESEVYGDQKLYRRALNASHTPDLTPEQALLARKLQERFEDAGAHLSDHARRRVTEINQRLSALFTDFSDRVLADEEELVTWLREDQLEGLPPAWLSSAQASAASRGRPELWAIQNTRSAVEPFLMLSPHRALRERVWRTFYERGALRPETETRALAEEMLSLRAERAELMGFETFAHQTLSRTMAKTPEATLALLREVWEGAARRFERDLEQMTALAREAGEVEGELAPWDVRFYAEQVRRRDYDLDPNLVQQYFSLDRLRDAMFWAAQRCFGWEINPAEVPTPHPDISAWSIYDREGGEVGLFYFDPFARPGKRSGAWMSVYRAQSWRERRVPPLVLNTCNFLKPQGDSPALLSLSDARTLFHEFGHAMHGLASQVKYQSLAGTAVVRDFVEFPSQLNERWLTEPELRARFCTHVQDGSPLPDALVRKIEEAANAMSGFNTLEYLASAVVDMTLHLEGREVNLVGAEARITSEWGLPSQVVMRHRIAHFSHIFSTDSYAAGYYCYLWADTLVADAADLFAERGFYDAELNASYHDLILSQGGSVDAAEAFRLLRGRDPEVGPLLRDRGLA